MAIAGGWMADGEAKKNGWREVFDGKNAAVCVPRVRPQSSRRRERTPCKTCSQPLPRSGRLRRSARARWNAPPPPVNGLAALAAPAAHSTRPARPRRGARAAVRPPRRTRIAGGAPASREGREPACPPIGAAAAATAAAGSSLLLLSLTW